MTKQFVVRNHAELQNFFPGISQLFLDCFGSPLSEDLWQWLYISNPSADPYVALALDGDRVVGHYGMISMPMVDRDGRGVDSYLSITSMVASSHRKHGLFAALGLLAYADAKAAGVDLVMGFPNKLAIPGRRKKLGWDMPAADYVAPLSSEELKVLWGREGGPFKDAELGIDLKNAEFRRWRLQKPGVAYVDSPGLVYKEFGDTIDLIYCQGLSALDNLPDDRQINVLLPHSEPEFLTRALFEYQYGGVGLGRDFNSEKVARQLIMSDVF